MFTNLRKSAQGFFAKLILLLLVAMFAMWGVGDVFRGAGGRGNVATVGKTGISVHRYQTAFKNTGGNQQQALIGLINDLLIEKEENALGLVVDDDAVAIYLNSIPDLHGPDGQFDKVRYQQMLMAMGKSEGQFIEEMRRDIAGKLLLSSLLGKVQVPEEMVATLYKVREERRTANIILLTDASVSAGEPTEEEVKAYYDANAKEFTLPEYRTLSYVTLSPADMQGKSDVSEEEIRRVYEERKDEFRGPERREVDDLQFDSEQDTRDAAKALADGKPFAEVARTAANKGKTHLGFVGAHDLPEGLADHLFTLKPDAVSEPLLVNFGWHIYRVGKTQSGIAKSFEEVRATLASEIAARDAAETSQKMINGFEDTLAGGATLEEAAGKIGQKLHTVGPVTQEGLTRGGQKTSLPPYDNFLTVAFATPEKDHSQAVQTANGSYFLVRVDSVSPAQTRPLTEVRRQAAKGALKEKAQAQLQKTAQELSQKLREGKKADAIQGAASGKLKRSSAAVPEGALAGKKLPQGLLGEMFRIRVNETTHAYPTEGGNYMIATLTAIIPAPGKPDARTLEEIRKDLKATLTQETLYRYLSYLRGKYPVSINAAVLKSLDEQRSE